MKSIFKIALGTLMGIFLFFLTSILVFFFSFVFFSSSSKKPKLLKNQKILQLKLDKPIVEGQIKNASIFSYPLFSQNAAIDFRTLLEGIKKAKEDQNILFISLEITQNLSAGITQLRDLREALLDFKKSGKKIYVYGQNFSQMAYYLASSADHISLHPFGSIDLRGLGSNFLFYKNLLDKFQIEPSINKIGQYKSAVEPYLNSKMSKESKEQATKLIYSIWNNIKKEIKALRPLKDEWIDNLETWDGNFAKNNKLVDDFAYYDEFEEKLKLLFQKSPNASQVFRESKNNSQSAFISISEYLSFLPEKKSKNKVALIYSSGLITQGEGSAAIEDAYYKKIISKIKEDETIKSVVFRINSPGGDFFASENIYHELILLKKKKPLVVSMGDVAASGGYYIAAAADEIVASPLTITGSIGVFSLGFRLNKLLEKIGITTQEISTNKNSLIDSFLGSETPKAREIRQKKTEKMYLAFLNQIDKVRGDKIKAKNFNQLKINSKENKMPSWESFLAQGRVWTGKEALTKGLVDKIGSLEDAIDSALKKANLTALDYQLIEYPKKEKLIDRLMQLYGLENNNLINILMKWRSNLPQEIFHLRKKMNIEARLPFEIPFGE